MILQSNKDREGKRMQTEQIVAGQTLVMFLYMLIGYILSRTGKLSEQGSKDLASILIYLILPAVIIKSFCETFTTEKLVLFSISTLLAAVALGLCMGISRIVFRKAPIDFFSASFSNAGFMGIPLVQSLFGIEAVSFLVGYIALMNLLQWGFGLRVLTGGKVKLHIKTVLTNPLLISPFIGLFLFCTGLAEKLPGPVITAVNGIAGVNGPVAMIVLGSYLAKSDLKSLFLTGRQYRLSAVRLILIPLAVMAVLAFVPVDPTIRMAVFIASAAPVGANVAVYAQLFDLDYPYACQSVALSTILSILTMPPMIVAASFIFR